MTSFHFVQSCPQDGVNKLRRHYRTCEKKGKNVRNWIRFQLKNISKSIWVRTENASDIKKPSRYLFMSYFKVPSNFSSATSKRKFKMAPGLAGEGRFGRTGSCTDWGKAGPLYKHVFLFTYLVNCHVKKIMISIFFFYWISKISLKSNNFFLWNTL